MRKIDFKFLWLFLASTVTLLLAGCSGTGIARTPTEKRLFTTQLASDRYYRTTEFGINWVTDIGYFTETPNKFWGYRKNMQ